MCTVFHYPNMRENAECSESQIIFMLKKRNPASILYTTSNLSSPSFFPPVYGQLVECSNWSVDRQRASKQAHVNNSSPRAWPWETGKTITQIGGRGGRVWLVIQPPPLSLYLHYHYSIFLTMSFFPFFLFLFFLFMYV